MRAIEIHNLSKHYTLGAQGAGGIGSFVGRRLFSSLPEQARRATTGEGRISGNVLRALDDVSFDADFGDVLGIMGPNGAGKSTLLKLLSRITAPTSGTARLRGRVGALLEVGTGFNYELTGRENVYLNGLVLGMTRVEVDRRFDEIVTFAGVEDFLDTPVKRYSSGMVTRLGFAVAAHLEPEILIVDEILAVGDVAFQRQCIDKMRDIARDEGRVVIFISHSVEAVLNVCTRAIRLDAGRLVQDGSTRDVVKGYLENSNLVGGDVRLLTRSDRQGTGELQIVAAVVESRVNGPDGTVCASPSVGLPLTVTVTLSPHHDRIRDVSIELAVKDLNRNTITVLANVPTGQLIRAMTRTGTVEVTVPRCSLVPGHYWIDATVKAEGRTVDQISGVADFDVLPAPFYSDLILQVAGGGVLFEQNWTIDGATA